MGIPGSATAPRPRPLATAIDFHATCVRAACGLPPRVATANSLYAGVRFLLADREGRFLGLDGLAEVVRMGAVEHVFMEVTVGATLRLPPEDYDTQRVAAVVARAPEHAAVLETLDAAARRCRPRIGRPDGGATGW
ncbi:MAG TPA: hypothetical protein VKG45_03090 [Actinomycetes bacterium]|nr:hypothetical protein [Actinomycetes bacterium]